MRSHHPQWIRTFAAAITALAVLAATAAPAGASGSATDPICKAYALPVRLADPGPATQTLWGQLCRPRNSTPTTVQFLVHGGYSNHAYWDLPVGNGYYSYVRAAVAAGYATFNIDLIGSGNSSHPQSSLVTGDAGAVALHDAITALRDGSLDGRSFAKVIWVGHALGSFYAWREIPRYGDVDAAILTSALDGHNTDHAQTVFANSYPAADDPKFAGSGYDTGYLTTRPGTRASMFYYPATTDPAVVAADEAAKDVIPLAVTTPAQPPYGIRVPVLVVAGAQDWLLCQGVTVYDCDDPASVRAYEASYYPPEANLQVELIPATGHSMALATTAPLTDSVMLNWAAGVAAPR
ncbi:alpha/beta hydrolase [Symbioplanes lichenis]|uniref:alpha/beta hydrolase n=1 Tax=Symbioplanes lichenis TaxID=1629072 RepID=UPI002738C78C|nr:alpha/beta fold hydrolase [Actinoplanes lichenis]